MMILREAPILQLELSYLSDPVFPGESANKNYSTKRVLFLLFPCPKNDAALWPA